MKKFTNLVDKKSSIDFNKKKQDKLSNDIDSLDKQVKNQIDGSILEGDWEIVSIIDVTTKPPKIEEAIIINAEIGNKEIKRGEFIYITALINKKGSYTHQNQMGVIKARITEIYNTLLILNNLK